MMLHFDYEAAAGKKRRRNWYGVPAPDLGWRFGDLSKILAIPIATGTVFGGKVKEGYSL